ncbi:MAG TPA: GNAT family N-acetyltransferase [Candidatus Babeliales bacterium]|nr:GNAT family N-acetyltransferase [Candidatus Babeliales bacterium]
MIRQKSFDKDRRLYEYDILDVSGTVVGMAQLRLVPSKSAEMPAGFESNVYYEVKPAYRNHGYATTALRLVKKEAKKHGLTQLSLTADEDNIASRKVIEKDGGRQIDIGKTSSEKVVIKYLITL